VCGGGGWSLLKDGAQKPSVNCTTQSKQHRQTAPLTPLAFRFGSLSIEFEAVSVFAIQKSFQQVIMFK
jgi:hypothetical protein